MIKSHGMDWEKYRDVMICQFCGKRQWKANEKPDFVIYRKGSAYLAEVKQSDDGWRYADEEGEGIRKIQRDELDRWETTHNPCFLFLVLGAGRAPKGRSAWLIPWSHWKLVEENLRDFFQQKSIARESKRNIGADSLLMKYETLWNKGGWTIPDKHIFWDLTGGLNGSTEHSKDA